MTIWSPTIYHSALGRFWKKHKYIRKEGDRYIYANRDRSRQQMAKELRMETEAQNKRNAADLRDLEKKYKNATSDFEKSLYQTSVNTQKSFNDSYKQTRKAQSDWAKSDDYRSRAIWQKYVRSQEPKMTNVVNKLDKRLKPIAKKTKKSLASAKSSFDKAVVRGKQAVNRTAAKSRIWGRKMKKQTTEDTARFREEARKFNRKVRRKLKRK